MRFDPTPLIRSMFIGFHCTNLYLQVISSYICKFGNRLGSDYFGSREVT